MRLTLGKRARLFISYYRPYKTTFTLDVVCSFAASALSLVFPLCVRAVTNGLLDGSDAQPGGLIGSVAQMGLVMLGIILAKCGCSLYYDWQGHAIGARMEGDMRRDLFARLQRLPVAFFDRETTGALLSRITNDLEHLAEIQHHGPEDLLNYSLMLFGATAIMFSMNVPLTFALLGILAVTALYAVWQSKLLVKTYRSNREKIAELSSQIEDSLSGIRDAKAFAAEDAEAARFRETNGAYTASRIGIYKREAIYYSIISELLAPLLTVTALIGGAFMIARGSMSVADLVAFLLYVGYFATPMLSISRLIQMTQSGMAGFRRFAEIIEKPVESGGRDSLAEPVRGRIEFRDVSFRYGKDLKDVLTNLSLTIQPGETVALVGASGAGKSTLASLIARFYEPDAGEILIDGVNVNSLTLDSLRRSVGFIRQDTAMFLGTVAENILFGRPNASRAEVVEAAKLARAHEFISQLPNGYDTFVGQRGVKLSGGQRQRVALARLFLKNPPIVILDEATSALDNDNDREIRKALAEFASEKHRTTLIIAHRLESIERADRVLRLTDAGCIEADS
ncbi:ABC transporter ATP-binding protein [Clostridia bacterium]|nr:ABC transporter ATP-binding protein [Clostridia bacterium]